MFAMGKWIQTAGLFLASIALLIDPALAHHVMGGQVPVTFRDGLLSGLAHPIIGIDHFAAVVAVACLASTHRAGSLLVVQWSQALPFMCAAPRCRLLKSSLRSRSFCSAQCCCAIAACTRAPRWHCSSPSVLPTVMRWANQSTVRNPRLWPLTSLGWLRYRVRSHSP